MSELLSCVGWGISILAIEAAETAFPAECSGGIDPGSEDGDVGGTIGAGACKSAAEGAGVGDAAFGLSVVEGLSVVPITRSYVSRSLGSKLGIDLGSISVC